MTFTSLPEDSRNRTYVNPIIPNENWGIALRVGEWLGHWKRVDFNQTFEKDHEHLPKTKERVTFLQQQGISDTYAKAMVTDNNDLNSLVWRTFKTNRREWHKDVAMAKKHPKNKKMAWRAKRAEENLTNPRRVTHGGNKLWRQAQSSPEAMAEFKAKRHWIGGIGRSDFKGTAKFPACNYYTNQAVRIDDKLQVWISVPAGLRDEVVLERNQTWVCVGSIDNGSTKNGRKTLADYYRQGRSVTNHIQFINGVWCVRSNLRLDPVVPTGQGRLTGIDVNAGHLDYTVLDTAGNPCGKSKTLTYTSKKDIPQVLDQLAADAAARGATVIGIELLSGMQRNCTRGGSRAKNRKVASIPSGVFKREILRIAQNRGWELRQIDAAGTSANTPEWDDVVPVASGDGHHTASYLIGRKALGHSIRRENGKVVKTRRDSGRSEFDLSGFFKDWAVGGEDSSGGGAVNGSDPPI